MTIAAEPGQSDNVGVNCGATDRRRLMFASFAMRRLDRYVMRQLAAPFTAIVAALTLVLLLERAQRLLQEMAGYGMNGRYFLPLLLWQVPYHLAQAIPAAFAATLIIVVARMATDHEWEAMAAAGVPPRQMARAMTALALFLAAATLLVSGWLEPVGRHGYRNLHTVALSESRIRALQPLAIYAPTPNVMLSADAIGRNGLQRVFLWLDSSGDGEVVATAPQARVAALEISTALEFILADGQLLTADNREVRFGEIRVSQSLDFTGLQHARGIDAREHTLSELLAMRPSDLDRRARNQRAAEIFGRISRALGIVALPWLVLPLLLASRAKRRWPAVSIIIALMLIFYHGANFCRNLAANGQLDVTWASAVAILLPLTVCAAIWWLTGHQRAQSPLQWLSDYRWFNRRPAQRRELSGPMGLSAYLPRQVAAMTAGVLVALIALFQVIDLLDRGEALIRGGQGLSGFVRYAWYRLPGRVLQAAPVAMLGGGLLALARMRATNELAAIHTLGISVFGILKRTLIVPLMLGLAMIGIAEFWSPRAELTFSPWWDRVAAAETDGPADSRRWFRMGEELVNAEMVDTEGRQLGAPRIYRRSADGRLIERVSAQRAVWTGTGWQLKQATTWRPAKEAAPPPSADLRWPTKLLPIEVRRFFAASMPLSGREAWEAGNAHAPVDKPPALYRTRILMSFSIALTPLVMLVLVVPLIVAPRREKRMAVALFQAVACGLSFLVANSYCLILGQTGELPPWPAVLLAPLVFAGIGIELILRADRGD